MPAEGEANSTSSEVGKPLIREFGNNGWNTSANADAIRQFCYGNGIDNPVFIDADYASKTASGSVVAPGTFLYSVDNCSAAIPHRGPEQYRSFAAGTDWEWFVPIRLNDSFTVEARIIAPEVHKRTSGEQLVIDRAEFLFSNQNGTVVGRATGKRIRINAQKEGGLGYEPREAYQYSQDELMKIYSDAASELVRGSTPRYWEDVRVGEELPGVIKGPLTLEDQILYRAATGPQGRRAMEIKARGILEGKGYVRDKSLGGAYVLAGLSHESREMALQNGMPGPYHVGSQTVVWYDHLLTNWMGDGGFVSKIENVRLRRPVIWGDTTWCKASVTGKREVSGSHLVDVELRAINQLGVTHSTATSVVRLPSVKD